MRALALPGTAELRIPRARVLTAAADVIGWTGEVEGYVPLAREAADIFREEGDARGLADALMEVGAGSMMAKDLADARLAFREALAIARAHDDARQTALALTGLGVTELSDRRFAEARRHLSEANRSFGSSGDGFFFAFTARCLGYIEVVEGRHDSGRELYAEALRRAAAGGFSVLVATILDGFARVALDAGDHTRAGRLAGSAAVLRERGGAVAGFEFTGDDVSAELEAALGRESAAAAMEEGGSLTTDEAVRYALEG